MLTTIKEGSRIIDPTIELLDSDPFKYGYTKSVLDELGCSYIDTTKPIRGDDPWYLTGSLHGISIYATFNMLEDLKIHVEEDIVSYNNSMKDTLNSFMKQYRETWNENNQENRRQESHL